MKVKFCLNNKFYYQFEPGEKELYKPKVPLSSHRFKRGTGTCSFDQVQYEEFVEGKYTHIVLIDPSIKKALCFTKTDVLSSIVVKYKHKAPIFVAELMELYKAGRYLEIGVLQTEDEVEADKALSMSYLAKGEA